MLRLRPVCTFRTLTMRSAAELKKYSCLILILLSMVVFFCFLQNSKAAKEELRSQGQNVKTIFSRFKNRNEDIRDNRNNDNGVHKDEDNQDSPNGESNSEDAREGSNLRDTPRSGVQSYENCEGEDFETDFDKWICKNEHHFDRLSKRLIKTKVTGHVFMRDGMTLRLIKRPQLKSLYNYVMQNMKNATRFCETGFNGGHSSMMWAILFEGKIEIISFDMCNNQGGCDVGVEEIHRLYPNIKHTLIRGDSTINVPKFTRENPDIKCDLLFVDGGHSGDVPEKDLYNFKPMAKDYHIVVMDDSVWNTTSGYTNWIGKAIDKGVKDKLICPVTCKPMYIPEMKRLHSTCFHKYCK